MITTKYTATSSYDRDVQDLARQAFENQRPRRPDDVCVGLEEIDKHPNLTFSESGSGAWCEFGNSLVPRLGFAARNEVEALRLKHQAKTEVRLDEECLLTFDGIETCGLTLASLLEYFSQDFSAPLPIQESLRVAGRISLKPRHKK